MRVALVTGASRGIGAGIAVRLAKDGAAVVVNYSNDAEGAGRVVQEISEAGGTAIAIRADLANLEIEGLFAEIDARFGRLDILVNNAGVGATTPLDGIEAATFDRVFAINARAPLFCCQAAARRMETGSRIINISSSSTLFPMPGLSVYAASKAVVKTYTEVLAQELGPRGILVNSVVPGATSPGMFDRVPDEWRASAVASSPFKRLGTPDDVAGVVAFLCSDDARWVTGQHILANGGAMV
jgi:3-oxoacyl-[acyl-carrier protein] reductase